MIVLNLNNYVVEILDSTSVLAWTIFTPKRFEPRPPFFSMLKYDNSGQASKNFKFFSSQVFQIFDFFKHGSPEN